MTRQVQTTPIFKLLFSSRETATACSISERTLWTLSNEGKIRVCKIRGANRYHIDDILAFIEASKTETRQPRGVPMKKPYRAAAAPDTAKTSKTAAAKRTIIGGHHLTPKR